MHRPPAMRKRRPFLPWLAVSLALIQGVGELLALQRSHTPKRRR